MKKVLLFSVLAVFTLIKANGQTEKSALLLGGQTSFSTAEGDNLFQFSPNLGVFVIDNLAVGGEFNLFTTDGFTSWGVGPFARYYFTKNTSGKPFLGAALSIAGQKNSDTNIGFGAQAGYALFLNKSIALEFAARYNRMQSADMLTIGAGFQLHLGKK